MPILQIVARETMSHYMTIGYYWKLAISMVLVLTGGLLAGLTIGLMSLDSTNLAIISVSGTEKQKAYVKKIMPLRKNGHRLLVTLLLGNTILNETLPIVFDSIFEGGVKAVIMSTVLILLFGEVIPQSVCVRYGLAIGAFFSVPLRFLQVIFSPIVYPIASILDYAIGKDHGIVYRRAELKELVNLSAVSHGGALTHDEVTIIRGALDLSEKMVVDVMTDMNSVYMLEFNDTLDMKLINEIVDRGHSRIPVYKGKRSNIVGVLLVKSLILINPKECIKVGRLQLRQIPWVLTSVSLYDILNAFQEGGSHMAVVASAPSDESAVDMRNLDTNRAGLAMKMNESTPLNIGHRSSDAETSYASSKPKRTSSQFSAKISYKSEENWTPLGIITLEDVIEELIQEEIVDETDVFIDIKNKIKVARAISSAKLLPGTFSPHSITRNKSTTSYHKRSMLRNDSSRLQSGPACQSEINTESYGILVSQPEEQNSSSLGSNTPTFKV